MTAVFDARWIRGEGFDGISRYTFELLNALGARGHSDLKVLTDPESIPAPLANLMKEFQWQGVRAPCSVLSLREPFQLPKLLRQQRVSHYFSPQYLVWPFSNAIKTTLVVHDLIPLSVRNREDSLAWQCFYATRFPTKAVIKRADQIVAVSRYTHQQLQSQLGIANERIRVVTEGVNERFFESIDPQTRTTILQKYQLPERFLLSLARPEPYKNLSFLLEAYAKLPIGLRRQFPVVIAGPEHRIYQLPQSSLVQELKAEGQLICPGYVDEADLPAVYAIAQAFVLPSLEEGFGLAALEAMAAGTPCLLSDIPALREFGLNNAVFFSPYHRETLTQALTALINDPDSHQAMAVRARDYVRRFRWSDVAQQIAVALEANL